MSIEEEIRDILARPGSKEGAVVTYLAEWHRAKLRELGEEVKWLLPVSATVDGTDAKIDAAVERVCGEEK